jgi:lysophospholipase L1-like esterase
VVSALLLAVAVAPACGDDDSSSSGSAPGAAPESSGAPAPPAFTGELGPGPITLVALGDSLTAGDGDDSGFGYAGRVAEVIGALPGREGTMLVNFLSGWDSTMMVDGQEGTQAQLAPAVDEVRSAVASGGAALATVLIGSNDMWYVYAYGPEEGTPTADEDAVVATYRANLERTISELQAAGAVVVVGLPDDQSLRPGVVDLDRLNSILGGFTAEEIEQMSQLSVRLDTATEEVAADHGVLTVDTNDPFWGDQATMADDGIHPNGAGYEILAGLWLEVIQPLL